MSCDKSPKVIPFEEPTEESAAQMLHEIECSLARIDADLSRIMGSVESSHFGNPNIRKLMLEVIQLTDLRMEQLWRAEGFDREG